VPKEDRYHIGELIGLIQTYLLRGGNVGRKQTTGGRDPQSEPPVSVFTAQPKLRNRNLGDLLFKNLTLLFAIIVFSLVFVMAYEMYKGSSLTIQKFGWKFLWTSTWDPVQEVYGAAPYIYGTIVSSLIALVLALPLSVGVSIFLSEMAPRWLERTTSFLVELLAAIPSIVYGLWGMFVLVPFVRRTIEPMLSESLGFLPLFRGAPYGFGMLTAGIILAIMILPIITSISRDVMSAVPNTQREAALALGATKWETTMIVLSSAKSGIFGASLLGLGRAIGETMAVTMVIGNVPAISSSLLDPGYSMASVLANEFSEASTQMHLSALIEIGLILFAVTFVLNAVARLIVWSVTKQFAQ
jgi:phosphate transport system permease protein